MGLWTRAKEDTPAAANTEAGKRRSTFGKKVFGTGPERAALAQGQLREENAKLTHCGRESLLDHVLQEIVKEKLYGLAIDGIGRDEKCITFCSMKLSKITSHRAPRIVRSICDF